MIDREYPPCETCERPVNLPGAHRCNLCYEVETRLGDYARSERGRANLRFYGIERTDEDSITREPRF